MIKNSCLYGKKRSHSISIKRFSACVRLIAVFPKHAALELLRIIIWHPAVRQTAGCRGCFAYSFMISSIILAPRRKLFWNSRHSAMS